MKIITPFFVYINYCFYLCLTNQNDKIMKDKGEANDVFLDEIIDYLTKMEDEDRYSFAMDVIYMAALYGGSNHLESMGMLQCSMLDFHSMIKDIEE